MLQWHHLPFPLCTFHNVQVSNHANIHVVDLHGLACTLEPFHVLLMHHDFFNEQPQQFRRQFLNVGVAFGLGAVNSPLPWNGTYFAMIIVANINIQCYNCYRRCSLV